MFGGNVKGTVTNAQRPLQKTVGMLARIGLVVLLCLGLSSCGEKGGNTSSSGASSPQTVSADAGAPPEPARTEFKTGDAVPAGYLGYKVFASWFSAEGAGGDLYVDLAIVNTDKKERTIAILKLIDETGKEYALSKKSPAQGESVLMIGKISPNMSKRAMALFEVPKGHVYKLRIQGFTATDQVQIALEPAAAPPSR